MSTEQIIKSLEPQISLLSDKSIKDRPAKKRAIENVKKELCNVQDPVGILEQLYPSLFIFTESQIENIREQAVNILISLIKQSKEIKNDIVEHILEQTIIRMKHEQTEEVRAIWMQLANMFLTNVTVKQSELIMNLMTIASQDSFHEIQKQAGKLIIAYCQAQAKLVDYSYERIIKLCFPLISHKHTATRIIGVKAVETILLISPNGLKVLLEGNMISKLTFDTSGLVRDNLYQSLCRLICNWPPSYRYQYGGKILLSILCGQYDELPDLQSTCSSSLVQIDKTCCQDLLDSEIITEIPDQEQMVGLCHFVHICYKETTSYLLPEIISTLIKSRQEIYCKTLKFILEKCLVDDLVESLKKLIQHLFILYANQQSQEDIKNLVFDNLTVIIKRLPSVDIYIELLLSKLDRNYLNLEKNGFEGKVTVVVILEFLQHMVQLVELTPISQRKIADAIQKPYLTQFLDQDALEKFKQSILK